MKANMTTPEAILTFWFGDEPQNQADLLAMLKRWGPGLDLEVRDKYSELIEDAVAGRLDHWADTETGTLALILALDQLPRHAHRGTARQYAGDAKAVALAEAAWNAGWPEKLAPIRAIYVLLPLAHSEKLAHQERQLVLSERIARSMPEWYGEVAGIPASQAKKYHALIVRFGRFPHRNALLGRDSTPAELEWLDSGGPESMPPEVTRRLLSTS